MTLLTSTVSALAHALPATRANRLMILIYHRVHPRPDPMFPGEVDAGRFSEQMGMLARYCRPLPLAEAVAGLKAGRLPPRAVCVTFDDGYADNATQALPILVRHGVPATFFVAPGFLDGGRMWNDSIIETVRRAPAGPLALQEFGLDTVTLADDAARGVVAGRILKSIKHRPFEERQRLVSRFCDRVGRRLPDDLMMTSSQVREMANAGMEIGAHTMTHPILRTLPDESARSEIARSRQALEGIVGQPVRLFAYPNGRPGEDYTRRDRDVVESLGFDAAMSTTWGAASRDSDFYQLPRFTPWDQASPRWFGRLMLAFRAAA